MLNAPPTPPYLRQDVDEPLLDPMHLDYFDEWGSQIYKYKGDITAIVKVVRFWGPRTLYFLSDDVSSPTTIPYFLIRLGACFFLRGNEIWKVLEFNNHLNWVEDWRPTPPPLINNMVYKVVTTSDSLSVPEDKAIRKIIKDYKC